MARFLAVLAMALVGGWAWAALPTTSVTITGTSGACLGTIGGQATGQLGPTAQFLLVKNESATDTIAFRLGYDGLKTAALNTAGSITLQPGNEQTVVTALLANSYLSCVSGGSSTPATVVVY